MCPGIFARGHFQNLDLASNRKANGETNAIISSATCSFVHADLSKRNVWLSSSDRFLQKQIRHKTMTVLNRNKDGHHRKIDSL
jgi:hypothetical protein